MVNPLFGQPPKPLLSNQPQRILRNGLCRLDSFYPDRARVHRLSQRRRIPSTRPTTLTRSAGTGSAPMLMGVRPKKIARTWPAPQNATSPILTCVVAVSAMIFHAGNFKIELFPTHSMALPPARLR